MQHKLQDLYHSICLLPQLNSHSVINLSLQYNGIRIYTTYISLGTSGQQVYKVRNIYPSCLYINFILIVWSIEEYKVECSKWARQLLSLCYYLPVCVSWQLTKVLIMTVACDHLNNIVRLNCLQLLARLSRESCRSSSRQLILFVERWMHPCPPPQFETPGLLFLKPMLHLTIFIKQQPSLTLFPVSYHQMRKIF